MARPSTTVVERFERLPTANCASLGGVVYDVGERAQSKLGGPTVPDHY